jgi:hypothetical protein
LVIIFPSLSNPSGYFCLLNFARSFPLHLHLSHITFSYSDVVRAAMWRSFSTFHVSCRRHPRFRPGVHALFIPALQYPHCFSFFWRRMNPVLETIELWMVETPNAIAFLGRRKS